MEDKLMGEANFLELLQRLGAVITDSHIVYTSGKHGSAYVNKDAIYPHTVETSELCFAMARLFAYDSVEVVVAPAIGGVILSQWVARHLTSIIGRDVLAVYAEKSDEGTFVIKRGYDKLIAHRLVLVVEDVLTTGGSVAGVVKAVRDCGGEVHGVAAICNRGGVTAQDLDCVPVLFSLVNVKLDAWDEADCPLCKQGVPINTDVGKGREFLARRR